MNPSDLCIPLRKSLPDLFECSMTPGGAVRVRTPFLMPDGDLIDVFVEERDDGYLLTDYGESLGWLWMQSSSGRLTSSQSLMVDDVCSTLDVTRDGGQLTLRCSAPNFLGEAVHILGQAVIRVCDLWFTFRIRRWVSVGDEVEDWLRRRSFKVARGNRRSGRSGREWRVDYEVISGFRPSLVFLLTSGSRSGARRVSEHVVAGCFDLRYLAESGEASLVSLFDDTLDVWRQEDIKLAEEVSEVVMWSRPDELERVLTLA